MIPPASAWQRPCQDLLCKETHSRHANNSLWPSLPEHPLARAGNIQKYPVKIFRKDAGKPVGVSFTKRIGTHEFYILYQRLHAFLADVVDTTSPEFFIRQDRWVVFPPGAQVRRSPAPGTAPAGIMALVLDIIEAGVYGCLPGADSS